MGCSSPQNASIPNIPSQHYQRLMQVSQINHPLNVNKKYEHVSKVNQNLQVGHDYKRTFSYECVITKDQLLNKRQEFWETRVNGNPEVWKAIRAAVIEPNCNPEIITENQGRAILARMKIHMLSNSIQMCVDSRMNKYEVPVFCINEPISVSDVTWGDKNLALTYEEKQLELKIRSTKYPNQDIPIKEKSTTDILSIKNTIRAMKELPQSTVIRLFYGGREMYDDKTLGNYSFNSGLVIQAMFS